MRVQIKNFLLFQNLLFLLIIIVCTGTSASIDFTEEQSWNYYSENEEESEPNTSQRDYKLSVVEKGKYSFVFVCTRIKYRELHSSK